MPTKSKTSAVSPVPQKAKDKMNEAPQPTSGQGSGPKKEEDSLLMKLLMALLSLLTGKNFNVGTPGGHQSIQGH